jgi:hypothetical protein
MELARQAKFIIPRPAPRAPHPAPAGIDGTRLDSRARIGYYSESLGAADGARRAWPHFATRTQAS